MPRWVRYLGRCPKKNGFCLHFYLCFTHIQTNVLVYRNNFYNQQFCRKIIYAMTHCLWGKHLENSVFVWFVFFHKVWTFLTHLFPSVTVPLFLEEDNENGNFKDHSEPKLQLLNLCLYSPRVQLADLISQHRQIKKRQISCDGTEVKLLE